MVIVRSLLPCALAATMFISCKDVVTSISELYVPVTVEGSASSTRTVIEGVSPRWVKGEQVAFFTSGLVLCPPFSVDAGGSSNTTFTGEKPSGSSLVYALYPYSNASSYSKSGIVSSLPCKQDGTFANAVMVACGSEETGFNFRNVCSVVKMNIASSLHIVRVEVYRDDRVSGYFAAEPSTDPVTVHCQEPAYMDDRRAVAVCDGGFSGDVYIAVLPSSSKNISLAFTDADGKVALISSSLPSGRPYSSGSIKDLGTVSSLSFGDAVPVTDATYKQL